MKPLLSVLMLLAAVPSALAQCQHCGCKSDCRKVCRPVCEIKEVPKITYDCECEEFCVPGPSQRTTVCDECGHKKHVYTPTCGKVRTRTKLVRNETIEKKLTYKWVIETLCCGCEARCAAAENATVKVNALGMATLIPASMSEGRVAPVGFNQPDSGSARAGELADSSGSNDAPAQTEKSRGAKFGLQRVLAPLLDKSRVDELSDAASAVVH